VSLYLLVVPLLQISSCALPTLLDWINFTGACLADHNFITDGADVFSIITRFGRRIWTARAFVIAPFDFRTLHTSSSHLNSSRFVKDDFGLFIIFRLKL